MFWLWINEKCVQPMKIVKIILFFVLFVLLIYGGYEFLFQQLVNEGSLIADKQCMDVNPLIIRRKNSYLNSMKIISDKGSADDYMKELKNYLDVSNKFIAAERKWLNEEKTYMNRWDYKLILPAEIQRLGQLQYISREADVKSTQAILDMLKTTDTNKQKEFVKVIVDQVKIGKDADYEYNQIYEKGLPFDWRMKFVKVPPSKCPKENLNIPNVPDLFSPPAQYNHGPLS